MVKQKSVDGMGEFCTCPACVKLARAVTYDYLRGNWTAVGDTRAFIARALGGIVLAGLFELVGLGAA
jgi:hypothetical protein